MSNEHYASLYHKSSMLNYCLNEKNNCDKHVFMHIDSKNFI